MKGKLAGVDVIIGMFGVILLNADEVQSKVKHALNTNAQEVYYVTPASVKTFAEMFSAGEYYGRLRSNTFLKGMA